MSDFSFTGAVNSKSEWGPCTMLKGSLNKGSSSISLGIWYFPSTGPTAISSFPASSSAISSGRVRSVMDKLKPVSSSCILFSTSGKKRGTRPEVTPSVSGPCMDLAANCTSSAVRSNISTRPSALRSNMCPASFKTAPVRLRSNTFTPRRRSSTAILFDSAG